MVVARFYSPEDEQAWDDIVIRSGNGTFLHTRRFLSYHGERFNDRSILIEKEGELLAVMPAAESPSDGTVLVSHPGATFGGMVSNGRLQGQLCIDALEAVISLCRQHGYKKLVYKAVPHIYHRMPSQDDLYALFRVGAGRIRCDLSVAIDTLNRGKVGQRRKRGQKKALKAGVNIQSGNELAPKIWDVLESNLARKHEAKPVHTVDEISMLADWFPEEIEFVAALLDGRVIAGVVLFKSPNVWHSQYIASSTEGYEVCALDMLFEQTIERARMLGVRYFDFGICNEDQGWILNQGLYQFKSEFGGSGVVHEFYEIDTGGNTDAA